MDEFFARNRLSAFIDGELPDAEMVEVAAAIEKNPSLQAEYEEMLAAVRYLRQHGPVSAPTDLHVKVMRAVDGLPAPGSRFGWLLRPFSNLSWESTAVVAVAVAVLALVWFAPRPERENENAAYADGRSDMGLLDYQGSGADGALVPAVSGTASGEPYKTVQPEAGGGDADDDLALHANATDLDLAKAESPQQEAGAGRAKEQAVQKQVKQGSNRIQDKAAAGELEQWVPEWDQDQQAAGSAEAPDQPQSSGAADPGALVASPFAFRLYPKDTDALMRLAGLAESLGGHAMRTDGGVLEPLALSEEQSRARVVLQIPVSQLDKLEPSLRRLGSLTRVEAPGDRLYSSNAVQVHIDIQYQP